MSATALSSAFQNRRSGTLSSKHQHHTANTSGTYIRLRNVNGLTCSNVTVTPLHTNRANSGIRSTTRASDQHHRLRCGGASM